MMNTYDAPPLPTELKPAVIDLLYRLADDAIVMGHRNSEWTGIGPILEEDIAFSSTAQDKMGHALAFYRLLHDLGEPDPDTLVFMRDAADFRCCAFVALSPVPPAAPADAPDLKNNPTRNRLLAHGDWAISLVRQFLFVEADVLRMSALESSAYGPLAAIARKLRGELKYHQMHAQSMFPRLASGNAASRGRMQAALDELYPHALGMFEPSPHDAELAQAKIAPTESSLRAIWTERVVELIADAGLTVPQAAEPADGGRRGNHGPELAQLLADMQKVHRLEPTAVW